MARIVELYIERIDNILEDDARYSFKRAYVRCGRRMTYIDNAPAGILFGKHRKNLFKAAFGSASHRRSDTGSPPLAYLHY